jgi:hypothetical protein
VILLLHNRFFKIESKYQKFAPIILVQQGCEFQVVYAWQKTWEHWAKVKLEDQNAAPPNYDTEIVTPLSDEELVFEIL